MRFWDSSAVLPLLVEQSTSQGARQLLRTDPRVVVWALTRTEVLSALHRLAREGTLVAADVARARAALERRLAAWTEIEALAAVRERAERLLEAHPLEAADACQLGAALLAVEDRPRRRGLVTSDETLAAAAEQEGFEVLRP